MKMSYGRFAAMIGTATVIMFGLMYSTVYALDHVTWSETRSYMALYMGAVMAIVMLGFMWKMYPNKRTNVGIVIGAAVVIAGGLFLARSQETVQDVSYMRAMIPHHSSAVLMCEEAAITDPEIVALCDQIVKSQLEEISQMKAILARTGGN